VIFGSFVVSFFKRLTVWLSLFSFTLLSSCATTDGIKNVMLPLAVVRKIVMDNIPGGVRKESMNGREITSQYFDAKEMDVPSETARERGRAVVTVLGSRRPYTVQVVVTREKRRKGSKKNYDKLGPDAALTKAVRKRIKDALDNRPADINVIGDFRAF
jgi:hypothetical protein